MAYTDYSQLFSGGEQKYGLRPGTGSALSFLESRGNPNATSSKGAQGLLQLMPGTARDMGVSNPYDPSANVDGGLHYFSSILNGPAKGDYRQAALMYNAGPNRASFPQSSQSYADQFMSRMGGQQSPSQPQDRYYSPQGGGQSPMPPKPMSLADMLAQQQPVNAAAPPPVNTDVMGTSSMVPQGNSLGAMAQSLPGMPPHQPSKFTAGNIMGVLGDALSAYGGRAPSFGPMLQQEQLMGKQQDFEREKFNNELQLRMFAMLNPADVMESRVLNSLPPAQLRQYLQTKDYKDPLYTTVNGSQVLQKRVQQPPSDAVAHLRGALSAGADRAGEVAKFNQIFGPGAAEEALGGQ